MNKAPNTWTLKEVYNWVDKGPQIGINNQYYPARPEGFFSIKSRFKLAWNVFTGKADALYWPGDQ